MLFFTLLTALLGTQNIVNPQSANKTEPIDRFEHLKTQNDELLKNK